jgi:lysophospholipase L1-like esterase
MKPFKKKYFILLPIIYTMAYSQTTIKPDDPNIQYFGRVDRSLPGQVAFDWPGVSIRAVFEGPGCKAVLQGSCCFDVFVDGVQTATLRTHGEKSAYVLAQGLSDRSHKLTIAKRCETTQEPVVFWGFTLDIGKKLSKPDDPPVRKIEFIGDSYTAGYANEHRGGECAFERADSIIFETTNTNKAFGPLVARAFGAQYHVIAISGKGLVRNYNGANPGKELPAYYDKTLMSSVNSNKKTPLWDFSGWKADVAIVAIGINDFQADPPYADSGKFDGAYERLISRLRKQYPNVNIVCCATKVWPTDALIPHVKNIVERQKSAGHADIRYFEFVSGNSALHGHPSVSDHQAIADSLIPVVANATGWRRTDMTRGK